MKTRRSFLLTCAVALALLGLGSDLARAAGLAGTIKSVDAGAGRLVVTETGTNRDVDVTVNNLTVIMTGTGRVLNVQDLRAGDGVGIAHVDGLASQIVVNPMPLTGIITSVDLDKRVLVVTEMGTDQNVTLAVDPRSVIQTNAGKVIPLSELRKGDSVGIAHDRKVAMKILVSQAPWKGLVESVDIPAKKLVVTEAGTDRSIPVTINDQTRIEAVGGKELALKDVKQGDGVSITHTGDVAETIVVNSKPEELTGHVKTVGADMKTLVVTQMPNGTDVTVVINDSTTIVTTDGKNLAFKDLKRGDGVGIAHHGGVAEKIVVNVKPVR
jgi:hypothetical protein